MSRPDLMCGGHTAAGLGHSPHVSLSVTASRAGPGDASFVFVSDSVSGCLLDTVPVPLIGKKCKNGSRSQSSFLNGRNKVEHR